MKQITTKDKEEELEDFSYINIMINDETVLIDCDVIDNNHAKAFIVLMAGIRDGTVADLVEEVLIKKGHNEIVLQAVDLFDKVIKYKRTQVEKEQKEEKQEEDILDESPMIKPVFVYSNRELEVEHDRDKEVE